MKVIVPEGENINSAILPQPTAYPRTICKGHTT